MTGVSLERLADTLYPKQEPKNSTAYGTVEAVNADGSYQVKLNASATTTRCAKLCDAEVGDRVFVIIQANGRCAAIGKVGGESSGGGNTYSLSADANPLKAKLTENGTGNAGSFTVPDGTTSQKGAVMLDNSPSADTTKAATPAAVTAAISAAKDYTDAQIVAAGAVTGVKGAAQENYQTGNVSLSASDVGAAPVSHTHAASSITTTDGNVQSDLDTIYQDIGDLDTALAGKANSTHYHSASAITSGTLGVARGGTGASTLGKGMVYHSASGTGALSIATAENIVSEIGNTPVNRAAADADGNAIATAASVSSLSSEKADKTEAIKNIYRSGLTFTATRCDDTTFTFDQRDTTYSNMTKAQADAGVQTGGYLISPKVLADYVAEHQGGGQSYDTLYYSLAGSHDNITLSASAANYDHMRIYFEKDSDTEARGSVDVFKPDGKSISTVLVNVYNGGVQFLGRVWDISGTTITGHGNEAWANCASGISGGNTSSYSIQIYRVEAW